MQSVSSSPPRAPPIKYTAPLGTRWAKEKAAAGGAAAFDLPTDPKTIGPWILGECVGKGASGRVKIAKHRRTGQLAAVKILPVAPLVNSRASLATQQAKSDKQRLGIDREITMMKLMNHPNIMRIYDVYEGDKELFLVLEYVEGGELFDFLVNRGRLPPNEALIYFRQILYGLNYAHTFSIIHRDLKPENILIASLSPPQIKIADWGMAAFAPPSLQLETSCGSPHYASPEIVNGEKYQGNATDIWSCGVILYALLTGRLPFDDKNVRNLLAKVKSGKYEMPTWIDPLAKDLLSKMLIVDVKQRITIPQILSHPWLLSNPAIPFSSPSGNSFTLLAPPLPPSPSILARPIPSYEMIDSELFSSLRIIWGRHADPEGESIKRDLCAPVGYGVHAKAFYFLLGKYREESYRNRTNDAVLESQAQQSLTSDSSTIDLETVKFNLGWELDHANANANGLRKYEVPNPKIHHQIFSIPQVASSTGGAQGASSTATATSAMAPPSYLLSHLSAGSSPVVGATSRKRTYTDGSLPSTVSKDASVAVPRLPPKAQGDIWKAQAQIQAAHQREGAGSSAIPLANRPNSSSVGVGRGGVPHHFPPRRGYTYSVPSSDGHGHGHNREGGVPMTAIGFSQHLQQLQARTAASTAGSLHNHTYSQRPKSSAGPMPMTPYTDLAMEKRAKFASPPLRAASSSTEREPGARKPLSPKTIPIPITSPVSVSDVVHHGSDDPAGGVNDVNLPLLTAPKMENPQLQKTMDDITQKVNDLVQAVTQAPASSGVNESRETVKMHPHSRSENNADKENQSIDEESWSHVTVAETDHSGGLGLGVPGVGVTGARDIGKDLSNVPVGSGTTAATTAGSSPTKPRKEKERKARPPPLDLPSLNPRRTNLAALGSPIVLSSPMHHPHPHPHPPSSANRIMASPVVGEFKGWFSNLFNWKQSNGHGHGPGGGVLYSSEDIFRTRSTVARLLDNMGITVSSSSGENYHSEQAEVLYCRVDQPIMDQATGGFLKNVRFRVEFKSGPNTPDPHQTVLSPTIEEGPYLLAAPSPGSSQLVTPISASGHGNAPRPRGSLLLGRTSSHGSSSHGSSSGAGGSLHLPMSSANKWDVPAGCLCVIALVHEKGSMSTFRAVWRRLKEEFGDAGAAYPCFSPALPPTTPYTETQRLGMAV